MRDAPRIRSFLLLALTLSSITACDDPTALRPAPDQDRSLTVALVLVADSPVQPLLVRSVAIGDRWEFKGYLHAEIHDDANELAAFAMMDTIPSSDWKDYSHCNYLYGTLALPSPSDCLPLEFRPRFGARYHLRVTAEDRPTVEGTTTVPGDFEIVSISARGYPPGTASLEAEWTASEGAHRYLVALRSENFICYNVRGCLDGWFTETDTTIIRTTVPESGLKEGIGPWHLDIYAVDRALYEYLTTGSGGGLFPVQPIQNVKGGYGVFGAYTRRSRRAGFP
jgi:hypothetical protein